MLLVNCLIATSIANCCTYLYILIHIQLQLHIAYHYYLAVQYFYVTSCPMINFVRSHPYVRTFPLSVLYVCNWSKYGALLTHPYIHHVLSEWVDFHTAPLHCKGKFLCTQGHFDSMSDCSYKLFACWSRNTEGHEWSQMHTDPWNTLTPMHQQSSCATHVHLVTG